MKVIYVPVKIESAEQAEALPEGTIMFLPAGPYVWTARDPGGEFLDHYGRPWHFENTQDDEPFTALVPVEAAEETREHPHRVEERVGYAYHQPVQQVRYKTPWEAV